MTTVLLVRHGETTWNRDERVQGWAPAPLSARGREQAEQVAAAITAEYDVDRLVASDLRRAKETVRPLARESAATVRYDRNWRERSFGVYQGLTYDELFRGNPEFALSEVGYPAAEASPEGGESLLSARERVLSAWEQVLADAEADETVAVITHGGPIRLVVAELMGLDVLTATTELVVANGSITTVATAGPKPELVATGEVPGDAEATSQTSVY